MSGKSMQDRNGRQSVGAKKNYAKGDAYALAFRMIKKAIECDCPLQAITIEESILADRLWSTLNVGLTVSPNEMRRMTLGSALAKWEKLRGSVGHGNEVPQCRFDDVMECKFAELMAWKKERNALMHGIAKSVQGAAPDVLPDDFVKRAQVAAESGLKLVRLVEKWTKKKICLDKKENQERGVR